MSVAVSGFGQDYHIGVFHGKLLKFGVFLRHLA